MEVSASFPAMNGLLPTTASALKWNEASHFAWEFRTCAASSSRCRLKLDGQEPRLSSRAFLLMIIIASGLSVNLPMDSASLSKPFNMTIALELNGSGSFRVVPVGRNTSAIRSHSTWPDPSFQGAFLPDSSAIDASGFTAHWTRAAFEQALSAGIYWQPEHGVGGKRIRCGP
jgi:hypothetical protein